MRTDAEFVQYYVRSGKGTGYHVGTLEGVRTVNGVQMAKIRPVKPRILCVEVPACDVETLIVRKSSEVVK